ncbi:MAG: branched-chain amino acid transport system permease protein [Trebonia sp.]|nr:natD [Actinomycetes bacterium]MDX6341490.1 branched-chain amino acid transport system permease protein [Trebonia sp.]MDX6416679.1 branched-chain amino acid transport system permease protein [Trebonia sp.]
MLTVQALGFGVVSAALIAIGAMGFTLQFGLTNVLNISYGGAMTAGAFAAFIAAEWHLPPAVGVVFALLAGALLTWLLGRTLFAFYARRGAGVFEMVMVTLAVSLIIQFGIDAASHEQIYRFSFPQGASLRWGWFAFTVTQLVLVAVAVAVYTGLELLLRRTKLGKALRAMADQPRLARTCGIPTGKIVNVVWLLSGALAGLAGLAYVINSLTIDASVGTTFLPLVLAAAILGKAGSTRGAVLAALLLGLVTEEVSAWGGAPYASVAGFGILAIVLATRPAALAGQAAGKTEITV